MITGTKAELEELQAIDDAEEGLPRAGVHVGGGRHVDLNHPDKPGWTVHLRGLRKHPKRDEYAYELREEPMPKHVSQADKNKYHAAKAKEGPLDASWDEPVIP